MSRKKNRVNIPNRKKVEQAYEKIVRDYEVIIRKLQKRIINLLEQNGLDIDVKYRVKSFSSYFEKILRLKNMTSRPELTDVLGLRIICPFLEDLDRVENILSQHFKIQEIERKGLKHSFREFGYDSIHMLIRLPDDTLDELLPFSANVFEVQLRTILQDAWAEVEHELIYKANFSLLNEPIKRKLASLNAILTLSDVIFQEIRDYQRETQLQGIKLRKTVEDKVDISKGISLLDNVEKPDLSNSTFDLASSTQPQSTLEKLLLEGLQYHSNGNFKKAIAIYSRILRMKTQDPVRSVIYNHRGMAYFVLSEYKKAEHDFSRALDYDDKNFRAYNNRAITCRMRGKYKQALDDFEQSLSINKSQYECFYMRALTYYDLNDWVSAVHDVDQALNIKPDFDSAKELKHMLSIKLFG